jgi:hypothetical protein
MQHVSNLFSSGETMVPMNELRKLMAPPNKRPPPNFFMKMWNRLVGTCSSRRACERRQLLNACEAIKHLDGYVDLEDDALLAAYGISSIPPTSIDSRIAIQLLKDGNTYVREWATIRLREHLSKPPAPVTTNAVSSTCHSRSKVRVKLSPSVTKELSPPKKIEPAHQDSNAGDVKHDEKKSLAPMDAKDVEPNMEEKVIRANDIELIVRADGMVNITRMLKQDNIKREPGRWRTTEPAKATIKDLCARLDKQEKDVFIPNGNKCTWAHPTLAIAAAQWTKSTKLITNVTSLLAPMLQEKPSEPAAKNEQKAVS